MSGAVVLDASALLVYLQGEPGAPRVSDALLAGAAISTVNWSEVLARVAEAGGDPDALADRLLREGLLPDALAIHAFDEADAREAARLRAGTRSAGLSLGDRACLALARRLARPALTADRAWRRLRIGIAIESVR